MSLVQIGFIPLTRAFYFCNRSPMLGDLFHFVCFMHECMDGWKDGRTDGWTVEWMVEWIPAEDHSAETLIWRGSSGRTENCRAFRIPGGFSNNEL